MSSDPLPVPESSATPRQDADYEAVHAALTATARGRKFLTEYVARSARADKLAATVAALEAATRDNLAPQAAQGFVSGLAELAVAIERIGAELTSDRSSMTDVHFAFERIQDVAMALRQRGVEAVLCDELDAAAREVGAAIVRSDAEKTRARGAAEQLREFARQIVGVTARSAAARPAEAARLNDTGAQSLAGGSALPLPNPVQVGDEVSQAAATSDASTPRRAALRDPLAALHALSDEELIALFS